MKDGLNFLNIDVKKAPGPRGQEPQRKPLPVVIAIIVAILCLGARFESGGWYVFLFAIPYLAVCVAHILIHWKASRILTRTVVSLLVASQLFLAAAFLLQWDIGDGEIGWLTITSLLENGPGGASPAPTWWPDGGTMDLLIFIPELVVLVALFWVNRMEIQRFEAEALDPGVS
jgi:hypothetical protein